MQTKITAAEQAKQKYTNNVTAANNAITQKENIPATQQAIIDQKRRDITDEEQKIQNLNSEKNDINNAVRIGKRAFTSDEIKRLDKIQKDIDLAKNNRQQHEQELNTAESAKEGVFMQSQIAEFELADELKVSNRKRIVRQAIHILSEGMKIAGGIATLTGMGAPAGVGLKLAGAGIDVSLPFFRAIKQWGRNRAAEKLAGGDTSGSMFNVSKSTEAKQAARKKHAITILQLAVDNLPIKPDPNNLPTGKTLQQANTDYEAKLQAFPGRASQIENYILATGVSLERLYAKNGQPIEQVKLLAAEMSKRELFE